MIESVASSKRMEASFPLHSAATPKGSVVTLQIKEGLNIAKGITVGADDLFAELRAMGFDLPMKVGWREPFKWPTTAGSVVRDKNGAYYVRDNRHWGSSGRVYTLSSQDRMMADVGPLTVIHEAEEPMAVRDR